jgi:anti-sigma regulatory factor (Ser/Thr protein kinase)
MTAAPLRVDVLANTSQWMTLGVPCQLHCGEEAMKHLAQSELIANLEAEESVKDRFLAALREVLWNAIEHGGKMDATKSIRLDLVKTSRSLAAMIRDPGPGFQIDDLAHAAVNNPPDNVVQHATSREEQGMRPGGFGILMARAYLDELIYNQQGNEVLLIRYLPPASESSPAAKPSAP